MLSIAKLMVVQRQWFSGSNRSFFGDISYDTLQAKSGQTYLIRSTYAWTDMFGQPKKLHYRINPVNANTYEIEPLVDDVFDDIDAVKRWLKEN